MGIKVREKEYLGVVNNIKKGYNSDLSSDCGNSFINHPEGFFNNNLQILIRNSTIYFLIYKRKYYTMKLSKEQVLGIVRHGLTFLGGILLIKGHVSEGQWYEISGAAMSFLSVVWSVVDKKTV